jgi:hypothetical protein
MLFRETVAVYCENHTEHVSTNSFRTSQETHYVSATKTNRLMLFKETVAVYCENHKQQNAEFWYVKADGIYCHVLMAPWLIITGFGLDFLTPYLQSLLITINYNGSQSIFSRSLLPWLPRTRSILLLVLRLPSDLRLDYLHTGCLS